jgi:two-component system response regulator RegX3
MTRILIIEDEISFSEALSFLLEKEGFETEVAETGKAGITAFNKSTFDLVLLDLMIPEISGIDVCRTIRTTSQIPIIMLTAKDSEVDKVVGLELGADDYVTKPYSARELVARIKAVLRRGTPEESSSSESSGIHTAAGIRMDIERHQVTVNGNLIPLPLKEFELLEFLLRNEGRVLTRGQLIDRVWGGDYYGDTKTLDVHIKRLRSKIEVDPANPVLIQTIRGLGYKFEA